MDPLTSISLVANIIAFINFGYEVVLAGREIRQSASGATAENQSIEFFTTKLQGISFCLHSGKPVASMTLDELRLNSLVKECEGISVELMALLDSLKPENPKSKRQALGAVFQSLRKKTEMDGLEARLNKCQQQLHLQLSQTTRFVSCLPPNCKIVPKYWTWQSNSYSNPRLETFMRLDAIKASGEYQKDGIQSLNVHVEALKDSLKGANLGVDLVDGIRKLLDRSDEALGAAIRSAILAALRFDRIHDRQEDIEEAHSSTFKWLLGESAQSEEDLMSRDEFGALDSEAGGTQNNPNGAAIAEASRHFPSWQRGWDLEDARKNDDLRRRARESFISWLSTGTGIFYISGKPGAGKSTLINTYPRIRRPESICQYGLVARN